MDIAGEMAYFLTNIGENESARLKFGSKESLSSQLAFYSCSFDYFCIFRFGDGRMGSGVDNDGEMANFLPNTVESEGAQL